MDNFRSILRKQLKLNNDDIVERVLTEQYEEGDLIEFSNALSILIRKEKEKK